MKGVECAKNGQKRHIIRFGRGFCVDEPLAARRVVDSRGEVPIARDSLDFEPLVG